MRLRHQIAFAAFVALTAACRDGGTEPRPVLQVTTTVTPAEFRAGTRVTVTRTVENRGSRTARIVDACADPFTLTTSAGIVVPTAERVCALIAMARPAPTVAPGERLVLTHEWRGDAHRDGPVNGSGGPLAPGEYRLRGHVEVIRGGSTTLERLPGSTVTIRVLP